jgi:predicted RNA methylase
MSKKKEQVEEKGETKESPFSKESYTPEEKQQIARSIKNICYADIEDEFKKLREIGQMAHTIGPRSRLGNNIVDYFTFCRRLETKGKYNVSFYEFVHNIDHFKGKKFIKNMLQYYADVKNKNHTKTEMTVLKEVYNICISAINIMRPLNCMEIFAKYKARRVLNFCAGWGGSTVAAAALGLEAFYGVDSNAGLAEAYDNMVAFLSSQSAPTKFDIRFCDAAEGVDYAAMTYDTVFASPPYYFIEKYENEPCYKSKQEMDERFYRPVFAKTYAALQPGGYYIINICREIYERVLKDLLGEATDSFPLKKSKRQNDHTEMVYVWLKKAS